MSSQLSSLQLELESSVKFPDPHSTVDNIVRSLAFV